MTDDNAHWFKDRITACVYYMSCPKTPDRCKECILRADEVARPWVDTLLQEELDKVFGAKDSFKFKVIVDSIKIELDKSDLESVLNGHTNTRKEVRHE